MAYRVPVAATRFVLLKEELGVRVEGRRYRLGRVGTATAAGDRGGAAGRARHLVRQVDGVAERDRQRQQLAQQLELSAPDRLGDTLSTSQISITTRSP